MLSQFIFIFMSVFFSEAGEGLEPASILMSSHAIVTSDCVLVSKMASGYRYQVLGSLEVVYRFE